jgi:TIR domain-containing protein
MPVFISHSHQDKDFVDKLATHLIKANAHVWVDRWEIKVGESILNRVQNVIDGASAVLFVLSKASVKSEWCKKELSAGLMRELEEKSTIVLPVLLEKCQIPPFLKEKKYADFTKNFDTGLKDIVDGIANVTNANQGRIEGIDYHIDWAQDWGYEEGSLILRYTLVEHSKELPFTILTEIIVLCNEQATARYRKYKDAGLGWVGRLTITEALNEYAEQNELKMVLTDQRQNIFEFSVGGLAHNRRYDVLVKSRWLGEDTGNDILVNIGNHLKKLKTYIKSICRPLTQEEQHKIVAIINY